MRKPFVSSLMKSAIDRYFKSKCSKSESLKGLAGEEDRGIVHFFEIVLAIDIEIKKCGSVGWFSRQSVEALLKSAEALEEITA